MTAELVYYDVEKLAALFLKWMPLYLERCTLIKKAVGTV